MLLARRSERRYDERGARILALPDSKKPDTKSLEDMMAEQGIKHGEIIDRGGVIYRIEVIDGFPYEMIVGEKPLELTFPELVLPSVELVGVKMLRPLVSVFGKVFGKGAAKGGEKLFGKEVIGTTTRMGRDGKAVEILFKDGSKIDINAARVKEWIPNTHPSAPTGTLQKVKFDNYLPGSKGYKRTPTQNELDFLNGL